MSSYTILTGKYILSSEWLDPLYTSLGKYQAGPSGYIPSSTISTGLPEFGEQYFPSYYTPHVGGKPMFTHFDNTPSLFGHPNVIIIVCQ